MAKPAPNSIVDVWNKTAPALESGDFSAIEQITLIHALIALNRNQWQPVKINPAIIAAATAKDKRTISAAIDKLIKNDMLTVNQKGGVTVGKHYSDKFSFTDPRTDFGGVQPSDTTGIDANGDRTVAEIKPARRKRTIFNNP